MKFFSKRWSSTPIDRSFLNKAEYIHPFRWSQKLYQTQGKRTVFTSILPRAFPFSAKGSSNTLRAGDAGEYRPDTHPRRSGSAARGVPRRAESARQLPQEKSEEASQTGQPSRDVPFL